MLNKSLLNCASHDLPTLSEQSKVQTIESYRIINATNSKPKSIVILNFVITAEISITKYSEDLNLIFDATNDVKHRIVHPQISTPKTLIQGLLQLAGSELFFQLGQAIYFKYKYKFDEEFVVLKDLFYLIHVMHAKFKLKDALQFG